MKAAKRTMLLTEPYELQNARWPHAGRVILAQFDEGSVIVYQAYRPSIGRFAVRHGYFGDGFRLNRMTWVKTNFLWMMYRSGWGTKEGQEVILAVRLRRSVFDWILAQAVHSTYQPDLYSSKADWERQVAASDVRLQWDPDRNPCGDPLQRRAIQLGLRRDASVKYAGEWILGIQDISAFVAKQRSQLSDAGVAELVTPREDVYPIADQAVAANLAAGKHDSVTGR